MPNIQGRSEKELVLVFVFCDMRTIEDKVAEVSLKSEETLKVSLKSGDTLYFPAGKVVEVGAMGVDVALGTGLGLKIFSAAQPEVQSLFFK